MTNVDEQIRRKFESDWLAGSCNEISTYLPSHDSPGFLATLEELICIDMEFRWSELGAIPNEAKVVDEVAPGDMPMVETYLAHFPQLREKVVLQRLVDQEIWARKHSRFPPQSEEYQQRFPELGMLPSSVRRALGDRSTHLQQSTRGPATKNDEVFPRVFGKYELLDVLGRGGMGVVYKARENRTGRLLAIKIATVGNLDESEQEEIEQRFETEMRAAAQVAHDHLMPIYDVGNESDGMYYTMPILDDDLASEIRLQPLSNELAAQYLSQAAQGIAAAHEHGLLHRDLKPQNLMLDREKGRVVVADFGLVRWNCEEQQLTRTGAILGTPPYMAPEQIQDPRAIDVQADVYALGATLYHALVGRPPFQATTSIETLRQVLDVDPVSPRLLNPEIDRDLETICMRCLQKDPALRFASAQELADDLGRFLRDEPIQSRPLGVGGRLVRWRRRNPTVASLTLALFSSLTILAIVFGVGWYRSQQQLARLVATSKQGQATLNELFTFVRAEPLLNQPGQEGIRKHLLERGLKHYERMLELTKENRTLPADVVAAQVMLAQLSLEIHGPEHGMIEFQKAITTAGELPQQQRASKEIQVTLGDSWNGLGQAQHRSGDYPQAITSFSNAVRIRRALAERMPTDLKSGRKLANATMNRGLTHAAVGQHEEAAAAQKAAQGQRNKLLARSKNDPRLLRAVAQGEFNLARLDLTNGQRDGGLLRLHDATKQFRQLTMEFPTDVVLWRRYIECLMTQSLFDEQPLNVGEATPLLEAIGHLRPLVMLAPENRIYRLQLARLYQQAIEQFLAGGNAARAEQAWSVVEGKLLNRFDEGDTQIDIVRVRLLHLRQQGLISLGLGHTAEAKKQLDLAIQAWKSASQRSDAESLNSPQIKQEWETLQKLTDSL